MSHREIASRPIADIEKDIQNLHESATANFLSRTPIGWRMTKAEKQKNLGLVLELIDESVSQKGGDRSEIY